MKKAEGLFLSLQMASVGSAICCVASDNAGSQAWRCHLCLWIPGEKCFVLGDIMEYTLRTGGPTQSYWCVRTLFCRKRIQRPEAHILWLEWLAYSQQELGYHYCLGLLGCWYHSPTDKEPGASCFYEVCLCTCIHAYNPKCHSTSVVYLLFFETASLMGLELSK